MTGKAEMWDLWRPCAKDGCRRKAAYDVMSRERRSLGLFCHFHAVGALDRELRKDANWDAECRDGHAHLPMKSDTPESDTPESYIPEGSS